MLAIFIIALVVAAPRVAKSIQRDREIETMHRGKQYIRAIKLYYRRFGRYPPNVDALVKTNDIRFLRKKYIDPTSGKEDWKPIAVGQNKTQSTGFFGKPIVGSAVSGLSGSPGMAPGLGGASPSGGAFSNLGSGSQSGTAFGASTDPSASGSSTPATDANGNPVAGSGTNSSSSTSPSTGSTNPTLGGLGIMGVTPNSPKQSILVWHKKTHYIEWEFFYDPQADLSMQGGNAGAIGQPAGSTPIGTGPGVGTAPGSSGSSFGGSFGSSPTGSGSSSNPPSGSP
jgi:type II secretory pathway pseudopilin PulG